VSKPCGFPSASEAYCNNNNNNQQCAERITITMALWLVVLYYSSYLYYTCTHRLVPNAHIYLYTYMLILYIFVIMCVCREYTAYIYELLLNIVRKRDATTPLRGGSDRSSPSVLQNRKKTRTQNVKTGVNVCIFIPVTLLHTTRISKTHCAPIQTDLSARRRRRSCSRSCGVNQHPSRIFEYFTRIIMFIYHIN